MFFDIPDRAGNTRRINVLFDKFPVVLQDGDTLLQTNTAEVIMGHDGHPEVINAVIRLLKTREAQSLGTGQTLKLL